MKAASICSSDFSFEHELYPAGHSPAAQPGYYSVYLNSGGAVSFCYERHGKILTQVCKPGHILMPASRRECEKISWSDEFDNIRISLAASLVDRLLETDGFRLKPGFGLEDNFLKEVAHLLVAEAETSSGTDNIYRDSLIVAYVIHLACLYSMDNKKVFAPKGRLSSNQLRKVIEFTRMNISQNIRLSEMASCVHLSEYHFARLFRNTLGVSPYKFVLEMKITSAKTLIRHQKRSFSDIAYMLNFSDQAHFSHVFKKLTGASPRHFSNGFQ